MGLNSGSYSRSIKMSVLFDQVSIVPLFIKEITLFRLENFF